MSDHNDFKSGYSEVNGIQMYYEIYGEGDPLVLIHGGGSTIQSTFGRMMPLLEKKCMIIAVELQNHGRSGTRDVPETFEQDADDVAALLKDLNIDKASFFGFSNGGTTTIQIAIRHPQIVNRLILAAAAYKRSGLISGFFEGMANATIEQMPQELKTAFLEVNPDNEKLQIMFERDRDRMIHFKEIADEFVRSIKAPTLIINGDKDVITLEHTIELYRSIPNAQLAIIPGGHGKYIGEITTIGSGTRDMEYTAALVLDFLGQPS